MGIRPLFVLLQASGETVKVENAFGSLYGDLWSLCWAVFGIGALISAVVATIQVMSENQEGAKKMVRWIAVTVAGFIIFSVLKDRAPSGGSVGKMTLAEMVMQVGGHLVTLLRTCLGLGALVSFVTVVVKVFGEDRDAVRRLVFWVVGFTLGYIALTAVANIVGF